jgi:hypothetical protein
VKVKLHPFQTLALQEIVFSFLEPAEILRYRYLGDEAVWTSWRTEEYVILLSDKAPRRVDRTLPSTLLLDILGILSLFA